MKDEDTGSDAELAPEELRFLTDVSQINTIYGNDERPSRSKTNAIRAAELLKFLTQSKASRGGARILEHVVEECERELSGESGREDESDGGSEGTPEGAARAVGRRGKGTARGTVQGTKRGTKRRRRRRNARASPEDDSASAHDHDHDHDHGSSDTDADNEQIPISKLYLTAGLYSNPPQHGARDKRFRFALPKTAVFGSRADFKVPYNVFCPSENGERKVLRWHSLRKNSWLDGTAKSKFMRSSRRADTERCDCSGDCCGESCFNRLFQVECNAANCSVGTGKKDCGNRNFANLSRGLKRKRRYTQGVEVVQAGDKGYGLRAVREYAPGSLVVEYTGEIIAQDEMERRLNEEYDGQNDHFYFLSLGQGLSVDGATKGSIARFANHSCEPNALIQKWLVNGEPRVGLFAGPRGIRPGDEVTYHYNFEWFPDAKPQPCYCGAPACTGFIGKKTRAAGQVSSSGSSEPSRTTSPSRAAALRGAAARTAAAAAAAARSGAGAAARNVTPRTTSTALVASGNGAKTVALRRRRGRRPASAADPDAADQQALTAPVRPIRRRTKQSDLVGNPYERATAHRERTSRRHHAESADAQVDVTSLPMYVQKQLSINMAPPGREVDNSTIQMVQLAASAAVSKDEHDRKRTRHAQSQLGRDVGIPVKYLKVSPNGHGEVKVTRDFLKIRRHDSSRRALEAPPRATGTVARTRRRRAADQDKKLVTRELSSWEESHLSHKQLKLIKSLAIDDQIPVVLDERSRSHDTRRGSEEANAVVRRTRRRRTARKVPGAAGTAGTGASSSSNGSNGASASASSNGASTSSVHDTGHGEKFILQKVEDDMDAIPHDESYESLLHAADPVPPLHGADDDEDDDDDEMHVDTRRFLSFDFARSGHDYPGSMNDDLEELEVDTRVFSERGSPSTSPSNAEEYLHVTKESVGHAHAQHAQHARAAHQHAARHARSAPVAHPPLHHSEHHQALQRHYHQHGRYPLPPTYVSSGYGMWSSPLFNQAAQASPHLAPLHSGHLATASAPYAAAAAPSQYSVYRRDHAQDPQYSGVWTYQMPYRIPVPVPPLQQRGSRVVPGRSWGSHQSMGGGPRPAFQRHHQARRQHQHHQAAATAATAAQRDPRPVPAASAAAAAAAAAAAQTHSPGQSPVGVHKSPIAPNPATSALKSPIQGSSAYFKRHSPKNAYVFQDLPTDGY